MSAPVLIVVIVSVWDNVTQIDNLRSEIQFSPVQYRIPREYTYCDLINCYFDHLFLTLKILSFAKKPAVNSSLAVC